MYTGRMPASTRRFRAWVLLVGGVSPAAEQLGCTKSYVSAIQRGRRRPSLRVATRIEQLTATLPGGPIMASEWVRTEEGRAA